MSSFRVQIKRQKKVTQTKKQEAGESHRKGQEERREISCAQLSPWKAQSNCKKNWSEEDKEQYSFTDYVQETEMIFYTEFICSVNGGAVM